MVWASSSVSDPFSSEAETWNPATMSSTRRIVPSRTRSATALATLPVSRSVGNPSTNRSIGPSAMVCLLECGLWLAIGRASSWWAPGQHARQPTHRDLEFRAGQDTGLHELVELEIPIRGPAPRSLPPLHPAAGRCRLDGWALRDHRG